MDPATRSDVITSLLNALQSNLVEFQTLLEMEDTALKQNDSLKLIELSEHKQKQANQIEQQVTQLTNEFGIPLNKANITIEPDFQNSSPNQQQSILAILELAEHCKTLNLRNGITIQALSNLNSQVLQLLTGHSPDSANLYDALGKKQHTTKSTLGKA